jgi:two-component system, chemotaxis family, chemotaxis protein CheY
MTDVKGSTVLIVDDSPTMRGMIKRTLAEGGYRVLEAANGPEGLARLDGECVQAILSDVNMPGMDGLTFVQRVRQDARFAQTPILFLTTEASAEIKAAGKAAGATGWIVKPFEPEQLRNVIARVIRRLTQPAAQPSGPADQGAQSRHE